MLLISLLLIISNIFLKLLDIGRGEGATWISATLDSPASWLGLFWICIAKYNIVGLILRGFRIIYILVAG